MVLGHISECWPSAEQAGAFGPLLFLIDSSRGPACVKREASCLAERSEDLREKVDGFCSILVGSLSGILAIWARASLGAFVELLVVAIS